MFNKYNALSCIYEMKSSLPQKNKSTFFSSYWSLFFSLYTKQLPYLLWVWWFFSEIYREALHRGHLCLQRINKQLNYKLISSLHQNVNKFHSKMLPKIQIMYPIHHLNIIKNLWYLWNSIKIIQAVQFDLVRTM
jgi:hypothetical protein